MNKKIKYGLIPAAGNGKRLGYLSILIPKTLFPLYDRPIIHYVVNQMESLDIKEIFIVVNCYKEKIIEYFKNLKNELKVKINFIDQISLDGTANAIILLEEFIKNDPFMVFYGDDCTITSTLKPMIDFFYKNNSIVTEAVIEEKDDLILKQTCSVNLDKNGKIIEILEKPDRPPYKFRGCGVYLFNHEIFNYIRSTPINPIRKEKEITLTINNIAKDNRAYGYIINGYNININDYSELLKASNLIKAYKMRQLEL